VSLAVLAALVAVGVGLIVAAIHFTGGSRSASVASADAARERFAIDYPRERSTTVEITADRRSAFLALAGGRVGLVHAVGAKFLTRLLGPGDVDAVEIRDDRTLIVCFTDFTFPRARCTFESADAAAVVARGLGGLTSGRRAARWNSIPFRT